MTQPSLLCTALARRTPPSTIESYRKTTRSNPTRRNLSPRSRHKKRSSHALRIERYEHARSSQRRRRRDGRVRDNCLRFILRKCILFVVVFFTRVEFTAFPRCSPLEILRGNAPKSSLGGPVRDAISVPNCAGKERGRRLRLSRRKRRISKC